VEIADLLAACAGHGHPGGAFVFGSTSKITFVGSGVGFFGSSPANVSWLLANAAKRTIGPDKVNRPRHTLFLKDEAGVHAHMDLHRAKLRPTFDAVLRILEAELGGTGGPQGRLLHHPEGARRLRPRGGAPRRRGGHRPHACVRLVGYERLPAETAS
jgi:DNA-binding transcriptional MocR family regulator